MGQRAMGYGVAWEGFAPRLGCTLYTAALQASVAPSLPLFCYSCHDSPCTAPAIMSDISVTEVPDSEHSPRSFSCKAEPTKIATGGIVNGSFDVIAVALPVKILALERISHLRYRDPATCVLDTRAMA